jgi:protein TonB
MTPRPLRPALAALGLLALLAPAGPAAELVPRDEGAALRERVRLADSVRVFRLRPPDPGEALPPGDDRIHDYAIVREGRADRNWQASMAERLNTAMTRNAAPAICARSTGPRHIRFGVQFFHGQSRTTFIVYLADRCLEYWNGRSFLGSAETRSIHSDLLSLVKRAFPTDTSIRNLDAAGLISCEDYVREHPGPAPPQSPPEILKYVPPRYPAAARKAGIQGRVTIDVRIEADGTLSDMKVVQSVPELDAAAIAAVREWKFEAAIDCWGQPMTTRFAVPVNFRLE